jgi:hypothetical protein
VRKILSRLVLLGAAAGAVYTLRNYLQGYSEPKQGEVQMVLNNGAIVEPGPVVAQEFADIARKILEISG